MIDLDLEAIKARLECATPGPWTATYEDADRWTSITGQGHPLGGDLWVVCPEVATCEGEPGPDADLIAHAPTDLAALAAEVEDLTDEVEQYHLLIKRLVAELEATRKVCEAARAYVNYEHGDGNLVDLEVGLNIALDEWEERSGNGG